MNSSFPGDPGPYWAEFKFVIRSFIEDMFVFEKVLYENHICINIFGAQPTLHFLDDMLIDQAFLFLIFIV
jgi:hypothetical protein